MSAFKDVRALFFDVFGTCVDWRTTVTCALKQAGRDAVSSGSLSDSVRARAQDMTDEDWADFAQQWRTTYYEFTAALAKDSSAEYKTVDQHHLDSLYDLLQDKGLLVSGVSSKAEKGSLLDDRQIKELSLVWHRLAPWQDTSAGIRALNKHYQTATLTNGNVSLIQDMVKHADMDFTHVLSAEMFNSYKPNPAVYLGAAKRLGCEPSQCAMVAAHLNDLQAAQRCGFRTIYVEREQEELYPELRKEAGLVDLWIGMDEAGFEAAAERLRGV